MVGVEGVEALDPAGEAADAGGAGQGGDGVPLGQVAGAWAAASSGSAATRSLSRAFQPAASRRPMATLAAGQASQYRVGKGVPSGSRGAVRTTTGSPYRQRLATATDPRTSRPIWASISRRSAAPASGSAAAHPASSRGSGVPAGRQGRRLGSGRAVGSGRAGDRVGVRGTDYPRRPSR